MSWSIALQQIEFGPKILAGNKPAAGAKVCTTCKQLKPYASFHSRGDSRRNVCRACYNKYQVKARAEKRND